MSPARRVARWLLLPAARIYVAVLFLLLILAGTLVAFSLSDVQSGNGRALRGDSRALRRVNVVAATDTHNEKMSIESRVSTVQQRCALTRLIADTMPGQTPQTRAAFAASLHKCLTQLKSVEALDASTR